MCGFIVRGKKSILFCLIVVFLYHCFAFVVLMTRILSSSKRIVHTEYFESSTHMK